MTITLKVGKYYQRADKSVHGPATQRRSGEYPLDFQWEVSGNFYNECGIRWDKPRSEDLVRECTRTGRPIQTKPRPKAKAKAKHSMLTCWGFSSTTPHGVTFLRTFVTREGARLAHVRSEGPIVRIQVPMPTQKGKK